MTNHPRALLRRFDRPGPRYATYPSPAQFGPHFNADMFRAYVRQSNAEPLPRRLCLHLHVPDLDEDRPAGSYGRSLERSRIFTDRLIREVELVGRLFDRDREVVQLHVGGALDDLTIDDLGELLRSVRSHFCVRTGPDADLTVEIDPMAVSEERIEAYRQLGFARAELRTGATSDATPAPWMNAIASCREHGFRLLSLTVCSHAREHFVALLEAIVAARPDRLSLHEHAPVSSLARARSECDARGRSLSPLQQFELAFDRLRTAGYEHLGLDQFVRPGDEWLLARAAGVLQRWPLGFSAHPECDVVGLGVGSISHVGDCLSQNARDLNAWESAIDAGRLPISRGRHLDFDDTVRAEVIRQIVCLGAVDIPALERRFLIDFERYFADACARLAAFEADGLVSMDGTRIIATSRGRSLLRMIATCFDRYCNEFFEPAARRRA